MKIVPNNLVRPAYQNLLLSNHACYKINEAKKSIIYGELDILQNEFLKCKPDTIYCKLNSVKTPIKIYRLSEQTAKWLLQYFLAEIMTESSVQ